MSAPEVPTFDDFFVPVLRVLADGEVKKRREIVEASSQILGLTEEQRKQLIPSATRTQLSNDGGIDGVIDQDAVGLSRIYVQAKRYAPGHPVGRPEVQAFVGALHGAQANQGVFLTTSSYSPGAVAYADSVPTRVVLIDGPLVTQLMIKHGVGVQVKRTIHLVEIDKDFFE